MSKFTFTYTDGSAEEYHMSDCKTVAEAINTHFGSNITGLQTCVEKVPAPAPAPAPA